MKKKILLFGTIAGLALAVSLLTIGVFAAMSHEFGINNSIHFAGKGEYVKFDLTGVVTGTQNDGAEYLTMPTWHYDWSDVNSQNYNDWEIEGALVFKEHEGASNKYCITYTFTITNNSAGGISIKAKIIPEDIDTSSLRYSIPQNDITIAYGTTGTMQLLISPISEQGFVGNRDCNFKIVVEDAQSNI